MYINHTIIEGLFSFFSMILAFYTFFSVDHSLWFLIVSTILIWLFAIYFMKRDKSQRSNNNLAKINKIMNRVVSISIFILAIVLTINNAFEVLTLYQER